MRFHEYNFAHISRRCNLTESSLFLWLFESFFPLFCDVSLGSFFFAYRSIYYFDIATGHCHLKVHTQEPGTEGGKKRRGEDGKEEKPLKWWARITLPLSCVSRGPCHRAAMLANTTSSSSSRESRIFLECKISFSYDKWLFLSLAHSLNEESFLTPHWASHLFDPQFLHSKVGKTVPYCLLHSDTDHTERDAQGWRKCCPSLLVLHLTLLLLYFPSTLYSLGSESRIGLTTSYL